jgi:CBS domain-containing protein
MLESELSAIITFNPSVIYETTPLTELLRQSVEADFHHWPVVNDEMQLAGIVSDVELARQVEEAASQCSLDGRQGVRQLQLRTAAHVMTAPRVIVSRWESQLNGLYHLMKNRIHLLPVVEEDRLIGLVTTTDYLREFSYGELPVSRHPASEWVEKETDPIECDATLDEAASVMAEAGVDYVGIVNGTLPLGVISMRDIRQAKCRFSCRQLLGQAFAHERPTTLRELAAKSPIIRPGARLSEAADAMVQNHRQAVAVVTQAGRFVGVLSEQILLSAMAGLRSALAT